VPDLDIRTLSFVALISSLILAAGMQVISRIIVKDPSLRLWAWGATAASAAYLLVAIRGNVYTSVSIILVNTLMIVSGVCMYLGNRNFRGFKPEFPWYWGLVAATTALIYYFTYPMPSLVARNVTISAALAAAFFPSAYVMLRPGDSRGRRERWFVAAACLTMAVFMGVRAIATPFMASSEQDFMLVASNFQKFSFVIGFIVSVALSMGLPLLVSGRLQRQLWESGLKREAETRKLLAAFTHVIASLATAVERRDSYSSGHQRRVAELAAAIAHTLGLDPARIEGLHFAATIHDIGMIYVPVEILARPGILPPIEFNLVKAHAQAGFDIVKDVEFPWPAAEMVRQHHERLDGSGFPLGLKNGQILLEARILAVADMVEAMTSHRPYREALGLDAALAQIRKDAGTKLDVQVVDACERVFREQGFAFAKT